MLQSTLAHADMKVARRMRSSAPGAPSATPEETPAILSRRTTSQALLVRRLASSASPHCCGDNSVIRPRRITNNNSSDEEEEDYAPEDEEPSSDEEDVSEEEFGRNNNSSDETTTTVSELTEPPSASKDKSTTAAPIFENILAPWAETKAAYEMLPCPKCLGKEDPHDNTRLWKPSLRAEAYSHGALFDVVITCNVCKHEKVIASTATKKDIRNNNDDESSAAPPSTRSTGTKYQSWKSKFREYPINYNLVLLTHVLGCGPDSIGTIFAFLGLAPSKGDYSKWKSLEDLVGEAEQFTSSQACEENIASAVVAYQDRAKTAFSQWLATEEGHQSTRATKVQKMQSLLNMKDGRVGVTVGMDGAWQRRVIGFGSGNSMSGHNFCVNLLTKKIVNAVVYSKQCTTCQRHKKLDTPPPPHRCSANFEGSAKSMEADSSSNSTQSRH